MNQNTLEQAGFTVQQSQFLHQVFEEQNRFIKDLKSRLNGAVKQENHFPNFPNWEELAHKKDLEITKWQLKQEIEVIRKEIEVVRKEIEIIRNEFKDSELKLTKEIKDIELKIQEQGKALELKIQEQGKALELKIQEQGKALELKIQEQGKALELKIQEQGKALELKIQEQGKEIVKSRNQIIIWLISFLSGFGIAIIGVMLKLHNVF